MIDDMKLTLKELQPLLAQKSIAVEQLMKNLAKEQAQADIVRNVVKKDEATALVRSFLSDILRSWVRIAACLQVAFKRPGGCIMGLREKTSTHSLYKFNTGIY